MRCIERLIFLSALSLISTSLSSCLVGESSDKKEGDDGSDGDADSDSDSDSDSDLDSDKDDTDLNIQFDGVDVLLVVDNSGSMGEEQAILSTQFFNMINALVFPTPDWKYKAVENLRVAVVSSDMGMQWGGNKYEDGDGWPNDSLPSGCSRSGDNGSFKEYDGGKTIDIINNEIKCDETAAQCPEGWSCGGIDSQTGIGMCAAPGGDGTGQICPGMGQEWAESTADQNNPDISFQAACMAKLGTDGCGFEQQLQASRVALQKNSEFIREKSLLAVVIVSDEEDCSIEDGPGLFMTDEIQGIEKQNVACGNNEEFLYEAKNYKNDFIDIKGSQTGVVFAAIVGVPPGSACEGRGNEISTCLDQNKMKNREITEKANDRDITVFEPACTREEGGVEVTKARPGRRYVELAEEFGNYGYIYSVCNKEWSPAMEDIAEMIAARLSL